MKDSAREYLHAHRTEVFVAFAAATALGLLAVLKRRFAVRAATWPTVRAKIENIFLDAPNSFGNPVTNAVLAYSYSVRDSVYSGQITLSAGESSLESLREEMIGQQISVQYDPRRPEVSIFTRHKVRGWLVESDRRLSVRTSIERWLDNLS
jgi:hypothetical protein